MPLHAGRLLRAAFAAALLVLVAAPSAPAQSDQEELELPREINDPLEPVNRLIWGFNKALTNGIIRPLANGYKAIVGKEPRESVSNFGRNLEYPGRVVNKFLQGRHDEVRDENARFLTNSTQGILGFYDPATKKKDIPKSEADTGQTLGKAGWTHPNTYLMLPGLGPSNERDALGLIGDAALRPLNYFPPYGLTYYGIAFNNFAPEADEFKRFCQSQADSYAFLKQSWTYVRENEVEGIDITTNEDSLPLETLQAIFFTVQNPEFPNKGRTRAARIPATGEKLQFTYWLQPEPAPVIYIVPGLGAHRLDRSSLALAELVFDRGFSAVSVSSGFNPEFIENASAATVPGYPPVDGRDLHKALTQIDTRLNEMHPGKLTSRGLLGFSMGGFHSLMIAAGATGQDKDPTLVDFERTVAINPPVNLRHGMDMLDRYYNAPFAWPEAERTARIEYTFRKVAALARMNLASIGKLPFDTIESEFLIGYYYRTTLRDIIYTSQRLENQGVLTEPIRPLRRSASYREIYEYSYNDYLNDFVVPYYASQNHDIGTNSRLTRTMSLRNYESGLRDDSNIYLVMSRNDFILAPGDINWLESIVPPSRMTVFANGGHMGNLKEARVQESIVGHFTSMLNCFSAPRPWSPCGPTTHPRSSAAILGHSR